MPSVLCHKVSRWDSHSALLPALPPVATDAAALDYVTGTLSAYQPADTADH